ANRRVRVTVSTPSGVLGVSENLIDLPVGGSINLATGIAVQGPRTSARVDLTDGTPVDPVPGNNMIECVISGGGPTAVPPSIVPTQPGTTPLPSATRAVTPGVTP